MVNEADAAADVRREAPPEIEIIIEVGGGGMKDVPMYVDSGRKVSLDIGYRYLWLGDAETGAVVRTVGGVQTADDPTVEDITAHELRVGLRYNLN